MNWWFILLLFILFISSINNANVSLTGHNEREWESSHFEELLSKFALKFIPLMSVYFLKNLSLNFFYL